MVAACLLALPVAAQTGERGQPERPVRKGRAPGAPQRPPQDQPPADGPARDPSRARRERPGPSRPIDRLSLGSPLQPAPVDLGPLRPGEERQLMQFARQRLPAVARMLNEFRQSPPRLRAQLERIAPRLRQLRRLFDENPQLADRLVRHIENMELIKRARRMLDKPPGEADPQLRQQILDEVRRRFTENLRIETQALEERAAELEQRREEVIQHELQRITSDRFDAAAEPPPVRELLTRLADTTDAAEREAVLQRVRQLCAQRVDNHIRRMREAAARNRADASAEVDRRVERFLGAGREDGLAAPQPP